MPKTGKSLTKRSHGTGPPSAIAFRFVRAKRQARSGGTALCPIENASVARYETADDHRGWEEDEGFTSSGVSAAVINAGVQSSCRPLWERMQPHERRLVYVSADRREGHFAVAAHRTIRYHLNPREFVFVGFRFVKCSNGTEVLTGWCDAERDCTEPSYRREIFPGGDFENQSVEAVQQASDRCPCASRLLQSLGGETSLKKEILLESARLRSSFLGQFSVGGNSYTFVNPAGISGDSGANLFTQWGVVKTVRDGHGYLCQSCHSRSRHCVHTHALLEGCGPCRTVEMPSAKFNARVKKAIDPATGRRRITSLSQRELPFFPEDDAVVYENFAGDRTQFRGFRFVNLHMLEPAPSRPPRNLIFLLLGSSHRVFTSWYQ